MKHARDPTARSYLVHRLGASGVDPELVFDQLLQESDVSIRRALLLALGEFRSEVLPDKQKKAFVPKLLALYRNDPDPGVHGAANWILRQWGEQQQVKGEDQKLATGKVDGSRQWYLTRTGQTMVILRGPVEFLMGSPASEPHRIDEYETRHRRRIGRSFAIASRTVTVNLWQLFLRDSNPAVRAKDAVDFLGEEGQPAQKLRWYDAARFCNWLSAQEGIPENQWCYQPNSSGQYAEGMTVANGVLARSGYRLPTEAEWEYACRAGATTSRYHGDTEELLPKYAWCNRNLQNETWPTGSLKPNDFGLFDMLGNVWQWCADAYLPYPAAEMVVDDPGQSGVVDDTNSRVLRGGAFSYLPGFVRCANRSNSDPGRRYNIMGLRVARSCN